MVGEDLLRMKLGDARTFAAQHSIAVFSTPTSHYRSHFSSLPPTHVMASYFCEVYEKKVVASLNPPHKRSDNKLTATERARVSRFFALIWPLLIQNVETRDGAPEQMASMHPKDIFCIREVIIFIMQYVDEPERVEIARLMGDEERFEQAKCNDRLMELFDICSQALKDKNMDGFDQPYKTPLGFFAMFDHWQEFYVEQFYPEHRFERKRVKVDN
jgi:hypothetical protein